MFWESAACSFGGQGTYYVQEIYISLYSGTKEKSSVLPSRAGTGEEIKRLQVLFQLQIEILHVSTSVFGLLRQYLG